MRGTEKSFTTEDTECLREEQKEARKRERKKTDVGFDLFAFLCGPLCPVW